MNAQTNTPWSSSDEDKLRVLWAEGLSTGKIAIRMGVTKNAVVGKAHRLHLTARPAPSGSGGHNRIRRAVPNASLAQPLPLCSAWSPWCRRPCQ